MSDKALLKLFFEFIVRIFDIPQIRNLMREILRGIDHKGFGNERLHRRQCLVVINHNLGLFGD